MKVRHLPDKFKFYKHKMSGYYAYGYSGVSNLGLLFLLCLNFCMMPNLFSHEVIDVPEEIQLAEALTKLSQKYEVFFSYDEKMVRDVEVTYEPDQYRNIEHALKELLTGTSLRFKIFDNRYIILYEQSQQAISSLKGMVRHLESVIDHQEEISQARKNGRPIEILKRNSLKHLQPLAFTVSGTVVDQNGETLIGVNIQVKGSNKGTATDIDGRFTLEDIDENAVLVISYIGFQTQEVAVAGKSSLNITMISDSQLLDEVVVVGYGTVKKKDLTGAVQSASLDIFSESPNSNILQSLAGSTPGLHVGKTNTAGSSPSIQIRGQNTLGGSTSPLIVLDGMIYRGNIGDINPDDVESVDILKDASSKAVYGSQAANGVILITTKLGTQHKPIFNVSTYYSVQSPANSLRALTRDEYIQAAKDYSWTKAYLAPDYLQENPDFVITDNVAWLENVQDGYNKGIDYNWIENSTSPGHLLNTSMSVTGGEKDFTYMVSFNYNDQKGWVMNDKYSRKTARINLKYDINEWLTIGTNSFGGFSDYSGDPPSFSSIAFMPPLITPYRGNEMSGELEPYPNGFGTLNPFMYSATDERNVRNQLMAKVYTNITIPQIKGLKYTGNYSYDHRWQPRVYFNEYLAGLTGDSYGQYSGNSGFIFDNILNYENQFGDHSINATLLAGIEERNGYSFGAYGTNFDNSVLSYYSIGSAKTQEISSGGYEEKYSYQMARLGYNYKYKYLLTGTLRKDGFSGFSKNNKFGYFPAIGIGWIISEEDIFKNNFLLSYLKLRASYGVNGNTVSRYSSLARISKSNQYVFDGESAIVQYITTLPNNELTWEKTSSYNFGIDVGLFEDKLMTNIDFYTSSTKDLLWDLALPELTGFNSIKSNVGEITNRGIEALVSANNVLNSSRVNWSFDLFFDANNNKIKSLIGLDRDGDNKEDDLISSNLFIGESIGTLYDYEISGIWQINESDDIPSDSEPGMYKYRDLNNDGKLTPEDDRKIIGRTEPAYSFAIQNSLTYNNFSLNIFIKSIQGGKNGYMKLNEPDHRGDVILTVRSWYADVDYWTPSNPDAVYRRQGGDARAFGNGTYQQRNFIRLQDISLSYTFSQKVLQSANIEGLKLYLSGKDLVTITDWLGWDPETGQGVAFGGYPVMKSISFGIDLKF